MGPDDHKAKFDAGCPGENPEFLGHGDMPVPDGPPRPRERLVFDKLVDSGAREEFETGSKRDKRAGKGRYDLVSPVAMQRIARHCEHGAVKYDPRNWEKGQPLHCYLDSALRHLNTYLVNRLRGCEPEEDHLAAAAWNVMALIHTEELVAAGELSAELDDILTEKLPAKPDFEEAVQIDEKGNICKSGGPEPPRCTCVREDARNARPTGKDRTIE